MLELFITYWTIGIIFMAVCELTSIIYIALHKKTYVFKDAPTPFLSDVLRKFVVSLTYPFVVILLIIAVNSYEQQRRQTLVQIKLLKEKIDRLPIKKEDESNE